MWQRAVGKVRVSISQHMSHLAGLQLHRQQLGAEGMQGAVLPCVHPDCQEALLGAALAGGRAWQGELHGAAPNPAVGRVTSRDPLLLQSSCKSGIGAAVSLPWHGSVRLSAGDVCVWGQ